MFAKYFRRYQKVVKRWLSAQRTILWSGVLLLVLASAFYASNMKNDRLSVDPASYASLLTIIGKAESGGNYNAYFGNARNTSVQFTDMSIGEVLDWQSDFISRGNYSSAVGKYQIINTTLSGLVERLGLDKNQKFNQSTQDELAIALLERRGSVDYINNDITQKEFAASIAKEWAGLPKMTGEKHHDSYYQSDGVNKSRASVESVLEAIEPIKALD